MKHLDKMRDFLYRIRIAWAVFRGDYGWVENTPWALLGASSRAT